MFGFLGRNTDASPPPTFRVFCEADEGRCLAVRDGALALAAANRRDKRQHWTKDVHLSRVIKDKDGHPVFSLVNKATGLALQHSLGPRLQVRLARFYPSGYDESVLWTESADLRKAFGCIRTMHNVDLCLDAPGDGTIVMLSFIKMNGPSESQSWKTVPWSNQVSIDELDSQPTSRIYCKHYEGFSVTVRNGIVCLASTDSNDKYQHWIEDKRPGDFFRDHDGYPAFVLVNKVTGEAISGEAGHNHPLKLKPYNPNFLDVSVFWTISGDMGHGFRCIHMADDIGLSLEASQDSKDNGSSTIIVLSCGSKGDNLQWKIVPWCKSPYSTHCTSIATTGTNLICSTHFTSS